MVSWTAPPILRLVLRLQFFEPLGTHRAIRAFVHRYRMVSATNKLMLMRNRPWRNGGGFQHQIVWYFRLAHNTHPLGCPSRLLRSALLVAAAPSLVQATTRNMQATARTTCPNVAAALVNSMCIVSPIVGTSCASPSLSMVHLAVNSTNVPISCWIPTGASRSQSQPADPDGTAGRPGVGRISATGGGWG